jgi:hypothetical protein
MMKRLLVIVAVAVLAACTDPKTATRVLEDQGYTNIQMTGYTLFSCSPDDTFHTGFSAKSPAGRQVSGTVCAGLLFKNSTIRFE